MLVSVAAPRLPLAAVAGFSLRGFSFVERGLRRGLRRGPRRGPRRGLRRWGSPALETAGCSGGAAGARLPHGCGICEDPGLSLCCLHWRADSYPLNHRGGPFLLLLSCSVMVWQVSLVLCLDSFFIAFCTSAIGFCLLVTLRKQSFFICSYHVAFGIPD